MMTGWPAENEFQQENLDMTIQHLVDDAHHDLTWFIGALARALFARAHAHEAVLPALERVASCDFSAPLTPLSPRLSAPCRLLPEALTLALAREEEMALALAASVEHLRWDTPNGEDWATATVLGENGPVRSAQARVDVVIAAPEARALAPLNPALLFVLCGGAEVRDRLGALHHVRAGEVQLARGLQDMPAEIRADGTTPLLAVMLATGSAREDTPFGRILRD